VATRDGVEIGHAHASGGQLRVDETEGAVARFLISTQPMTSHVITAKPVARELVTRGHDVWWHAGRRLQAAVEATGAVFVPIRSALDYDGEDLNGAFPERRNLRRYQVAKWDFTHLFVNAIPGQIEDFRRILAAFPADVLIADPTMLGAALLRQLGGPAYAALGVSVLAVRSRDTAPFGFALPPSSSPVGRVRNRLLEEMVPRIFARDVQRRYNRIRARLGLPRTWAFPMYASLSSDLYLQPSCEAFEYPRSDLPPQVRFIGPLLYDGAEEYTPPPWWPELNGERPVVHVTQGTIATDTDQLLRPTLDALADEDMLVVATTGRDSADRLGPVPTNARVERFIPHARLLPHVDVMVTNGGFGGISNALTHGVPLVGAGDSQEKPEVLARLAWSGAGINLKTAKPTPNQVGAAVRRVLDTPSYRENARRIQSDLAQHDGPREAVELLEQLAASTPPASRGS
jgi:MGT family glycosyltransferase